mmetsp:Transcript_387/g.1092  ORF Transcript_387/g.1092 Transcript_387/m.1092 type:complete len:284 (-) Transcript_387:22-873(-)
MPHLLRADGGRGTLADPLRAMRPHLVQAVCDQDRRARSAGGSDWPVQPAMPRVPIAHLVDCAQRVVALHHHGSAAHARCNALPVPAAAGRERARALSLWAVRCLRTAGQRCRAGADRLWAVRVGAVRRSPGGSEASDSDRCRGGGRGGALRQPVPVVLHARSRPLARGRGHASGRRRHRCQGEERGGRAAAPQRRAGGGGGEGQNGPAGGPLDNRAGVGAGREARSPARRRGRAARAARAVTEDVTAAGPGGGQGASARPQPRPRCGPRRRCRGPTGCCPLLA